MDGERYLAHPDVNGFGWCVYDLVTGKIAEVRGDRMLRLLAEEADDFATLLNRWSQPTVSD